MSTDITQLVSEFTVVLGPALPYLQIVAQKASEEAGKKLLGATWETAQRLWQKIWPRMENRPAAREAVKDVVARPDDEDALAALRLQLKKLLEEDKDLARELAKLWEEAKQSGATVIASGDRSVAIGGKASGNIIITGDNNKIDE